MTKRRSSSIALFLVSGQLMWGMLILFAFASAQEYEDSDCQKYCSGSCHNYDYGNSSSESEEDTTVLCPDMPSECVCYNTYNDGEWILWVFLTMAFFTSIVVLCCICCCCCCCYCCGQSLSQSHNRASFLNRITAVPVSTNESEINHPENADIPIVYIVDSSKTFTDADLPPDYSSTAPPPYHECVNDADQEKLPQI